MTLFFENETGQTFSFSCEEVAGKVIEKCLEIHQCPYECEVSVYLVSKETIREHNAATRQIDKVTDVLSFPNITFEREGDFSVAENEDLYYEIFHPESGELILGDIMLCYDRIIEQANEYGHSVYREFAFLVAHSILHLLGYDHMQDDEKKQMEEKQREILDLLNITRES